MIIFFVILVVVTCVVLGFFVLVQNPKGGGLSGSIAGFSNQFMGVKQTTDVLEKGTWLFAVLVAVLCLFSAAFIPKGGPSGSNLVNELDTKPRTTQSAPAPAQQQPVSPAPAQKK